MSTHDFTISDCTVGEDMEEIDAMELCPRDNTKKIIHGNDRGNRSFGPIGRAALAEEVEMSVRTEDRTYKTTPKVWKRFI